MLIYVDIKNIATVLHLQIDFKKGTSVITGETGAGKSVFIDALEFALGQRADIEKIRHGHERAEISLQFDITALPEVQAWLQARELNQDNECLLQRILTREGRSRCSINGIPVPLKQVREISQQLMDIHSQHEHQSLLSRDKQRELLDRYAKHMELVLTVKQRYQIYFEKKQALDHYKTHIQSSRAHAEFLRYQLEEFKIVQLAENEFEQLDKEHKQLANADSTIQHIQNSLHYLENESDHHASYFLKKSLDHLQSLPHLESSLTHVTETLHGIVIQVEEVIRDLQRYLEHFDTSPERLLEIEKRLGKLFDLARKHQIKPEQLWQLQKKLQQEFEAIDNSEAHIQQSENEIKQLLADYHSAATQLSESRQKAIKKLNQDITQKMQSLGFQHGAFEVHMKTDAQTPTLGGYDAIEFQVCTNPGHPFYALQKIASGGELSRLSLAIQIATIHYHPVPTLIFDEIDVGISGDTAHRVGKLLQTLGEHYQVICITHLAQVASLGHHHYHVQKYHEAGETITRIHTLNKEARVLAIARMIGGDTPSEKTRAHAQEMLESTEL